MNLYRLMASGLRWRMEAEGAHDWTLSALNRISKRRQSLQLLGQVFTYEDPRLEVNAFGRTFSNPLIVAAGLDKNGVAVPALHALGFAGVEVGTITHYPQEGKTPPRVFALPQDQAIINRMGFPNAGVEAVRRNLELLPRLGGMTGVNLGANGHRMSPHYMVEDIQLMLNMLARVADYAVINVSSPNTATLRQWQSADKLRQLLTPLMEWMNHQSIQLPLLVKVAPVPDIRLNQLDELLKVLMDLQLDGIVIGNTTTSRPLNQLHGPHRNEKGGLSGKPLLPYTKMAVDHIYRHTNGRLPIVACGGVTTADDVFELICAGANLVQTYTGLVLDGGPWMAKKINRELIRLLEQHQLPNLQFARGQRLSG